MTTYRMTTQTQVRAAFFTDNPQFRRVLIHTKTGAYRVASHNEYPTDTRCAFVDYVDSLQRAGIISESLAQVVTL